MRIARLLIYRSAAMMGSAESSWAALILHDAPHPPADAGQIGLMGVRFGIVPELAYRLVRSMRIVGGDGLQADDSCELGSSAQWMAARIT